MLWRKVQNAGVFCPPESLYSLRTEGPSLDVVRHAEQRSKRNLIHKPLNRYIYFASLRILTGWHSTSLSIRSQLFATLSVELKLQIEYYPTSYSWTVLHPIPYRNSNCDISLPISHLYNITKLTSSLKTQNNPTQQNALIL